jgi:uncharacterized protein with ParB-like and HNH nuclease domain
MSATTFQPTNRNFKEIMGNGVCYTVPKFQRNYSWEAEQWEDLWQDLESSLSENEAHYMGYLVFEKTATSTHDTEVLSIIDGQQRLTTITILILAVLTALEELVTNNNDAEKNKQRLETLRTQYIGFIDPISLKTKNKLTLNRHNDLCFRDLCTLALPTKRKKYISERLLIAAQTFFNAKIAEKTLGTGEALAEYISRVTSTLVFTTITVTEEGSAYTVFETLNARGVKLSTPDLLKNYLFSIIDKQQPLKNDDIEMLESCWTEITEQLGKVDFTKFVRAVWNSSHKPFVTERRLFKEIKASIKDRNTAFEFLQQKLRKLSPIYAALNDEYDEMWQENVYKGAAKHLRTLKTFNISQPFGLLLAAHEKFSKKEFVKILGYIATVSIRYNVIGKHSPNVQEGFYNAIACDINNGTLSSLAKIKQRLAPLYPNDADFKQDFRKKQMPIEQSTKKVRFLLACLEDYISGSDITGDEKITIEHILPQNPTSEWTNYFGDDTEEAVGLLGNMALLSQVTNKKVGTLSFAAKKQEFSQSGYTTTKQCCEYDAWDRAAIEGRQQWLAEKAALCWRIEFDS